MTDANTTTDLAVAGDGTQRISELQLGSLQVGGPRELVTTATVEEDEEAQRSVVQQAPRVKVLGDAGAKRLLSRLKAYGKSFDELLKQIKGGDSQAYESMIGVAIEDLPATCFDAIVAAFKSWDDEIPF